MKELQYFRRPLASGSQCKLCRGKCLRKHLVNSWNVTTYRRCPNVSENLFCEVASRGRRRTGGIWLSPESMTENLHPLPSRIRHVCGWVSSMALTFAGPLPLICRLCFWHHRAVRLGAGRRHLNSPPESLFAYQAVHPPSTVMFCPVMKLPASLASSSNAPLSSNG